MYDTKKRREKHKVKTEDGSLTLYSAEFDEHYHSTHDGALNESLQKHIIPAFTLQKSKDKLTILDICFGIGYNTLSTIYYIQKEKLNTKVHIISPEFDEDLVRSLKDFEYPKEFEPLRPIIQAISNNLHYEDEQFRIDVIIGDAREVVQDIITGVGIRGTRPTDPSNKSLAKQDKPELFTLHSSLFTNNIKPKFDIIYQDPFSPAKNPTLWTQEWFTDLKAISKNDTILTTYSIAAAIRLGLYESGWQVYELQNQTTRRSLIACPSRIDESKLPRLMWIDMELKKLRNPEARSLRDRDSR